MVTTRVLSYKLYRTRPPPVVAMFHCNLIHSVVERVVEVPMCLLFCLGPGPGAIGGQRDPGQAAWAAIHTVALDNTGTLCISYFISWGGCHCVSPLWLRENNTECYSWVIGWHVSIPEQGCCQTDILANWIHYYFIAEYLLSVKSQTIQIAKYYVVQEA